MPCTSEKSFCSRCLMYRSISVSEWCDENTWCVMNDDVRANDAGHAKLTLTFARAGDAQANAAKP